MTEVPLPPKNKKQQKQMYLLTEGMYFKTSFLEVNGTCMY